MFPDNLKIKDVKSEIGLLIKVLRKQQKLSRQDLADRLNLSRITIQNLESGRNFTIDTLLKVLEHFDVMFDFNKFMSNKRIEVQEAKSLY